MTQPLLKVVGLGIHYRLRRRWFEPRQTLRAVDAVGFELNAGEALGIVGESGSGKSSLARGVLKLVPPSAGAVFFMGRSLAEMQPRALRALRRDLQIIFQDPLASLDPHMNIGAIVAEPLTVHRRDLDRRQRARAVADMLVSVGLPANIVGRYPHEFSGGQCQRIGIARAMILNPKLLICDEPVSSLDVSVQAQIVNLLEDLKRDQGVALLFVSHNLAVVKRVCERVLVMYGGRMMELAPTGPLYLRPLHPYTRALLAAVPIADPQLQPSRLAATVAGEPPAQVSRPGGCVFSPRCPHAVALCHRELPPWETAAPGHQVACHRWRELAVQTSGV